MIILDEQNANLPRREIVIEATLLEEMLGTAPNNKEIYSDYIASKAPDGINTEDEIAAIGIDEYEEKQMTVFPRTADEQPAIFGYLIKGLFKNACSALRNAKKSHSADLTSYKKKIDGLIFIKERMLPIQLPDGGEISICQRPLRASTAQGERVALASSESVPKGSKIVFTIVTYDDSMDDLISEWLNYGKFNGLGQWHNSGKGRISCRVLSDNFDPETMAATSASKKKSGRTKKKAAEEEAV